MERASNSKAIICNALLFDLDGVLIDSTPAVERVWTRWAVEHGFEPKGVVARAHGRPSITTVRELLPGGDHDAENHKVERAEIEDLQGVVPLPGVPQFLSSLPADRWTIVTSCTRPLAEVRIRAAGIPMPARIVTSNDVTRGKPDPQPYLKGAAILGFAPGDCVVVEDAPAGVRAGKAAGMSVIGLRTTVAEGELKATGADWLLDGLSQLRLAGIEDGQLRLEISDS
jgi:sugar-phosphatase